MNALIVHAMRGWRVVWLAGRVGSVVDATAGVQVFAEADYCYGLGPVRMRVEHVDRAHPVDYDGTRWYRVVGVQLTRDGTERAQRTLLVRAARLQAVDPSS